jgi:hypothetical protein
VVEITDVAHRHEDGLPPDFDGETDHWRMVATLEPDNDISYPPEGLTPGVENRPVEQLRQALHMVRGLGKQPLGMLILAHRSVAPFSTMSAPLPAS